MDLLLPWPYAALFGYCYQRIRFFNRNLLELALSRNGSDVAGTLRICFGFPEIRHRRKFESAREIVCALTVTVRVLLVGFVWPFSIEIIKIFFYKKKYILLLWDEKHFDEERYIFNVLTIWKRRRTNHKIMIVIKTVTPEIFNMIHKFTIII